MGVGERGRMEGKVTLGFVGLGAMGSRMAKRLLDAGYPVVGYNRTPAKARWLVEAGLRLADSPRGAAEGSDVVFSMVTDTAALRAVALGPDGIVAGLGRGSTLVEMSTVSPTVILELAALAEARGAALLDAPARTDYQQRLEQAEVEMDNLRNALGWNLETSDTERALLLASKVCGIRRLLIREILRHA